MNTTDYLDKSFNLLNDHSTYLEINKDPLKQSQQSFNKSLTQILPNNIDLIDKFKAYLPILSKFYTLPKIHKENIPLRPIISNIDCITYKLAKWLSAELQPLIGNISTSHIKNSIHLIPVSYTHLRA